MITDSKIQGLEFFLKTYFLNASPNCALRTHIINFQSTVYDYHLIHRTNLTLGCTSQNKYTVFHATLFDIWQYPAETPSLRIFSYRYFHIIRHL